MVDVNGDVFRRKRKNACQDLIFEVNDSDFSPEASPQPADTFETCGPNSKLPRCQEQLSSLESNADSGFSQHSTDSNIPQQEETKEDAPPNAAGVDEVDEAGNRCEIASRKLQASEDTVVEINIHEGAGSVQANSQSTTDVDINIDIQEIQQTIETEPPQQTEEEQEQQQNNDAPAIRFIFRDETVASCYKERLINFLHSFAELDIKAVPENGLQIDVDVDETLAVSDEWVVLDDVSDERSPRSKKHHHHKKSKRKVKKELLFEVDTVPKVALSQGCELQYSAKFTIAGEEEKSEVNERKLGSCQTCFNCGEGHSLRDCPHPKDFDKIHQARLKFRSNQNRTVRYHLEEDQKYGHLTPGKITENLRKALGLKKHELPPYIYKMRVLGYPPGWVEEAKYTNSDLCMFGSDGRNVENAEKKKSKIKVEKIIDYPGFNVPAEKDWLDDYKYYNVPQYSEQFSKKAMLQYIQRMEDDLEACDMEVDKEEASEKCGGIGVEEKSRSPSPSLNDLEKEKEQLLSQLSNDDEPGADSGNLPPKNEVKTIEISSPAAVVKNSSFGTPILKSSSPYARLPNPDNFSINMSPIINFENLPNSTGKYEQMSGILQRVRTTLKGLQNESS